MKTFSVIDINGKLGIAMSWMLDRTQLPNVIDSFDTIDDAKNSYP